MLSDVDQVREVLFMDLNLGVTQNDTIQCVFSTPHCLISTPSRARFTVPACRSTPHATITITLSPPSTSSHVGHCWFGCHLSLRPHQPTSAAWPSEHGCSFILSYHSTVYTAKMLTLKFDMEPWIIDVGL